HVDGTGTALAGIAANVCPCEAERVAQKVDEERARVIDVRLENAAIDGHRLREGHCTSEGPGSSPLSRGASVRFPGTSRNSLEWVRWVAGPSHCARFAGRS